MINGFEMSKNQTATYANMASKIEMYESLNKNLGPWVTISLVAIIVTKIPTTESAWKIHGQPSVESPAPAVIQQIINVGSNVE